MDAKQKRALTQNIASIGLFDYSFTKDGRAYVEGFSADVTVPDDLVIPETVEYKGKTYKVTGISIGAFQTEQIVTVTTSKYINDIGQKAFQYCSKLESVDLSKSMHTLIPARLFAWCERLSDVKVGNHVQKVHEYAFSGCKSIENMQLPEECTTISRCGFEWCTGLKSFNCHVKTYDFGAFFNCNSLTDFDFSSALSIAPQAFRRTGFNQLDLPGNIRVIGEKGFADCYRLQKVTLEDGIEELGAFCFAKSEFESASLGNVGYGDKVKLDEVYAPKSIILIGADAFRNVGEVVGWTGSVAESKCISFNTPFRRLDATNTENSTSTRVKAEMFNINPIKTLKNKIDSPVEGKSNPEFVMKTDKLVDIEFGDNQLAFLNMQKSDENREPHILFKAVVNYLQDMADLLQSPFSNGVLRLQNTFYVLNTPLYDDGCNKISKITYQIMDTLESGSFIVVFMNNHLRFVCDCNLYTDIIMTKETFTDDNLPMVDFLHAGDVIGEQSTISGHDGILQEELEKYNVGQRFYNMILRNSFRVFITKKDSMIYVPCTEIFMSLHDKRADNIEGEEKIDVECQSVLEIGTYDQFIAELKKVKKNIGGSEKFFDELCKLSQSDVNRRVSDINTIEDEKEAQLFLVSKKFNQIVDSAGIAPNPNLLTYELFNELSRSYWMISKDEDWLQQTGRKSLNRTAEYHIGKYKLTEFKSNQIVKFSNPYMNGCKGAYVFTLTSGNNVLGVYASRFSMHYITEKLYDLTNIKKDVNIPDAIFTDADKIDKLSPNLFYDFYDVLYSKGGWSFKDFKRSYSNQGVAFNISMYKPTGVFYLTMTRTTPTYVDGNKTVKGVKTMPILPIGNMDRALMVATTTNTNAKDTNLYDELMELAAYNDKEDRLMRVLDAELNRSLDLVHDKYTAARKLIIAGVKDVSQYKKLIDDRAVYMLGTVHKGKLQREFGYRDDEDADEFEIDDIDISEDSIIDDDEIVLDDSDDEILLDDVDGEDGDPDESVAISFEEFFETAKQMGVTDEARARAMYVSFMSNK